ncbi:PREDICTED: uncharacterized protein LOC106809400 [Priapulus caudatus]|uniref:Uncharacterized protein LOC106809400 n=1 Tax=Priapulus caudatus TaxID=37621 RepID=A0ABM1E6Y2_PRICU|nr:PREDICTED: uncharacterized protein LOC106809400 [Priapulus caudatus]
MKRCRCAGNTYDNFCKVAPSFHVDFFWKMAAVDLAYLQQVAVFILIIFKRLRRRRNRRNRQTWTRQWIQRRRTLGIVRNLQQELYLEDTEGFRQYLRMSPESFLHILDKIKDKITKEDTVMRQAITAKERLSVTLRFLATGESFRSLSFQYRMGERTISEIIKETTAAIVDTMKNEYLKTPSTEVEWKAIAKNFNEKWDFPLCLGALDGKHVAIRQPGYSGSQFFNYKHFFSVILLALVDADYRFIYVDIGAAGRCGDAGVFRESTLKKAMDDNSLNFPTAENLEETGPKCSYQIIGDDAFPLQHNIMKPYPHRNMDHNQKIFNYRLSRARRVVENAFGILANRFRVFSTTICLDPDFLDYIIMSACILHNFLIVNQSAHYNPPRFADYEEDNHVVQPGQWRREQNLRGLAVRDCARNTKTSAKGQRELLNEYFNGIGAVEWQEAMIQ